MDLFDEDGGIAGQFWDALSAVDDVVIDSRRSSIQAFDRTSASEHLIDRWSIPAPLIPPSFNVEEIVSVPIEFTEMSIRSDYEREKLRDIAQFAKSLDQRLVSICDIHFEIEKQSNVLLQLYNRAVSINQGGRETRLETESDLSVSNIEQSITKLKEKYGEHIKDVETLVSRLESYELECAHLADMNKGLAEELRSANESTRTLSSLIINKLLVSDVQMELASRLRNVVRCHRMGDPIPVRYPYWNSKIQSIRELYLSALTKGKDRDLTEERQNSALQIASPKTVERNKSTSSDFQFASPAAEHVNARSLTGKGIGAPPLRRAFSTGSNVQSSKRSAAQMEIDDREVDYDTGRKRLHGLTQAIMDPSSTKPGSYTSGDTLSSPFQRRAEELVERLDRFCPPVNQITSSSVLDDVGVADGDVPLNDSPPGRAEHGQSDSSRTTAESSLAAAAERHRGWLQDSEGSGGDDVNVKQPDSKIASPQATSSSIQLSNPALTPDTLRLLERVDQQWNTMVSRNKLDEHRRMSLPEGSSDALEDGESEIDEIDDKVASQTGGPYGEAKGQHGNTEDEGAKIMSELPSQPTMNPNAFVMQSTPRNNNDGIVTKGHVDPMQPYEMEAENVLSAEMPSLDLSGAEMDNIPAGKPCSKEKLIYRHSLTAVVEDLPKHKIGFGMSTSSLPPAGLLRSRSMPLSTKTSFL
ncbi:hypothetical protein BJ742DRAFT_808796 [Cladochytrium replicatum]|nr:hypothetical protein BJ742DRAFT_808796 [Cladochytrium replicatum]